MSDWFESLAGIEQRVWDRLAQAAQDSALISLATVSPEGLPEVRIVVLRAADRGAGALEVYTDLQSDKIASLTKNRQASVVFWDEALNLQIRATCDVEILSGEAVMARWQEVPDHSRLSYGITPPPGTEIAESTAYQKAPDRAVFAVLVCRVTHLDAVHLGRPHRRAAFARTDRSELGEWSAKWLAP